MIPQSQWRRSSEAERARRAGSAGKVEQWRDHGHRRLAASPQGDLMLPGCLLRKIVLHITIDAGPGSKARWRECCGRLVFRACEGRNPGPVAEPIAMNILRAAAVRHGAGIWKRETPPGEMPLSAVTAKSERSGVSHQIACWEVHNQRWCHGSSREPACIPRNSATARNHAGQNLRLTSHEPNGPSHV